MKKDEAERIMELPWNLWYTHEWEDVSKEDPKDGVILDYSGNQLHDLC